MNKTEARIQVRNAVNDLIGVLADVVSAHGAQFVAELEHGDLLNELANAFFTPEPRNAKVLTATAEPCSDAQFNDWVPKHLQEGLLRYVNDGVEPGGFLCAVIECNMASALSRADPGITLDDIRGIYVWLYNFAPPRCFGSLTRRLLWQSTKANALAAAMEQDLLGRRKEDGRTRTDIFR